MRTQFGIRQLLRRHPIVPVVDVEDATAIVPIIEWLKLNGIQCIEITLRTEQAMATISKALEVAPYNFDVGVGTIVNAEQVQQCTQLGVDFMVSPGLTPTLGHAFEKARLPFLPGVMTASEVIAAQEMGYDTLKLYPFNIAGGLLALRHYRRVFPNIQFCPTGGINADNYQQISEEANVICVGGSWVLKVKK